MFAPAGITRPSVRMCEYMTHIFQVGTIRENVDSEEKTILYVWVYDVYFISS